VAKAVTLGRGPWFLNLPAKVRFHRWPFAGGNTVDAGVAKRSVACYLMAAQYTVQFCAQSLNSATALIVEIMRSKLDRDAVQRVKGMTEK
jgi:hypothetical protein